MFLDSQDCSSEMVLTPQQLAPIVQLSKQYKKGNSNLSCSTLLMYIYNEVTLDAVQNNVSLSEHSFPTYGMT